MRGTKKTRTSSAELDMVDDRLSSELDMGDDRLSSLPKELRHHVLSRLPSHEAFQTRALSRIWRMTWPSMPVLIFKYNQFPEVDEKQNRFMEFIHHTLAQHDDSRLKSFELHMLPWDECDAEIRNEWVTFAVQHSVENINLCGKIGNEGELLDSLFTCNSIMRMKLSLRNTSRKWPMAGAVKNLNKLVLVDMALPENLNAFISSSCPNLQTLSIKFCDLRNLTDFSISSVSLKSLTICLCEGIEHCEVTLITPSLETLRYTSDDVALDYSIMESSSLSEAKIKFVTAYWAHSRCIYHQLAIKLARGLQHAKRITFNEFFLEFVSEDENPSRELNAVMFNRLEMMSLSLWPTRKQLLMGFLLLSRCPKLSTLKIAIARPRAFIQDRLYPDDIDEELEVPFMLNQLISVKITSFEGNDSQVALAMIFLQNCASLREMKIKMAPEIKSQDQKAQTKNKPSLNSLQLAIQRKSKVVEFLELARQKYPSVSISVS